MVLFYASVPVSQHAQHEDPDTEAVKWISAVIIFIIRVSVVPLWQAKKVNQTTCFSDRSLQ